MSSLQCHRLELSTSPQVTRIAKLPDADVSQWRMPNKEIVGRTELVFIWISHKYSSAVRGQFWQFYSYHSTWRTVKVQSIGAHFIIAKKSLRGM